MNTGKGSPYFKDLNRKDYVALASKIIKEEGVKAISIRRLANDLGCSSASMYRYFKNMDELLFYAQLDALNEYILDLSRREKDWKNIWDAHFGIWESYAGAAFRNPKAFEVIFYQNLNKDLGEALKEYYDMFPETIVRVSPMIKKMLEVPSYYERDFYMCSQLIKEGEITYEHALRLNHVICTLFLGYFKFVQENGIEEKDIPGLVDQFISESRDIVSLYAPRFAVC